MKKYEALIIIILISVFVGCDPGRQDPQDQIDPVPEVWGEENCMGDFAIKASPITGNTSTEGFFMVRA